MITPPVPPNETERLEALRAQQILDTPAEERFDRITRLAQRMFGVPIVAVSLVDRDRQWFKSIQGLAVKETSRDVSFCGHAILNEDVMVVEDALRDERFHDNPLVTGDPQIRFYAGCPLQDPEGLNLGTLCLIDRQPRQLDERDLLVLQDLARIAAAELNVERLTQAQRELLGQLAQAERRAQVDDLTQLWNRAGILALLEKDLAHARRHRESFAVLMADIDRFKSINDTHGHPAGDAVLREVAARIRETLRVSDSVGRVGGEEFLVVLPTCNLLSALRLAERVRANVASRPVPTGTALGAINVTLSLGVASDDPGEDVTAEKLVAAADGALYSAKRNGRNRVESAPQLALHG